MDFGIYLRDAQTYPAMLERAKKAETLGFTHAFLNDHVHGFAKEGKEPYLDAWTTMTGIGLETNLRVGQIVLFNSLRHPAVLAKMIATLDNMTNGRYELIIGAGWNESEYVGYDLMGQGQGMPPAGERVDRLKESVQILRAMLSNEITSFDGEFYTLHDAINIPQPVQSPFRISIGGTQKRIRRIAAKYADGINFTGTISKLRELHSAMIPELDRYGKSVESYYFSGFGGVRIVETEKEAADLAEQSAKRLGISVEQARKQMLIGTAEELTQKMGILRDELNFKLMVVVVTGSASLDDPLVTFADQVMKQI